MNIMLLAGVQQFMPAPATGLVLLMLLALGAFLAGLSLSSLQICSIAWLKQFALFLLLGAVLLVGLGLTFWPRRQGNERAARPGDKET
jgi:membrane protein implicated in regulation of membrane protease activity